MSRLQFAPGVRSDADGYIGGRRLGEHTCGVGEAIPKTHEPGRRCACGTVLSIYNGDTVCASCSGERWASH